MIKVFDIYEYVSCDKKNDENYFELQQYMVNNKISINESEIIISGRIIDGVIGIGDNLFLEAENQILKVNQIYAYGREFDHLTAGMTCAIKGQVLKSLDYLVNHMDCLYKKRKQNILSNDFEYWITLSDGLIYRDIDNVEIKEKLEKLVCYLQNNGDFLIQKLLINTELYDWIEFCKEKYNVVQTVYEIIIKLQADALNFWLQDEVITIIFSVSERDNCLYGHYIQVDFDMEWELIGWESC